MQVFAYCMRSMSEAVWQATGVHPVTCPPFNDTLFNARILEAADVIWLGLHADHRTPAVLYGDERTMSGLPLRINALRVGQLADLRLEGKIVFAPSCYLPDTHFPEIFKLRGATVIGGPGKNWGSPSHPTGADKLGQIILSALQAGKAIIEALALAHSQMDSQRMAEADALEFSIL